MELYPPRFPPDIILGWGQVRSCVAHTHTVPQPSIITWGGRGGAWPGHEIAYVLALLAVLALAFLSLLALFAMLALLCYLLCLLCVLMESTYVMYIKK